MTQWQEDLVITFRPAHADITPIQVKTESVLIVLSNPARRRMFLHNVPGGGVLYVAFASEASVAAEAYSLIIEDGGTFQGVLGDYTGDIAAIRDNNSGHVIVTEVIT